MCSIFECAQVETYILHDISRDNTQTDTYYVMYESVHVQVYISLSVYLSTSFKVEVLVEAKLKLSFLGVSIR